MLQIYRFLVSKARLPYVVKLDRRALVCTMELELRKIHSKLKRLSQAVYVLFLSFIEIYAIINLFLF